jgi:hypothetical protein
VLALSLAERLAVPRLEHFDVQLLFTGAEKAMAAGMRRFRQRHGAELSKQSTVVVNLDEVGSGSVRCARKEGPLISLKGRVQPADVFDAPGYVNRSPGDGYAARLSGFPAITVSCGPARARKLGPELAARVSPSD